MNRILIFLLLFYCCSPNKEKNRVGHNDNLQDTVGSELIRSDDLEKIINQNFLAFVDTYAYAFRSFFINSPPKTFPSGDSSLVILIDTTIHGEEEFSLKEGSLKKFKENNRHQKFIKLLEGPPISATVVSPDAIRNTGKYTLRALGSDPWPTDIVVGKLSFYTPYIGEDAALLYVLKDSGPKAARLTVYLFEKDSTRWKIVEKDERIFF